MENGLQKLQELARKAREDGIVDQKADGFLSHISERKESAPVSLEEAEKIFGKDFLGPEEVSKVFGVILPKENLLPIPFSRQELENAKALGQQLIYQAAGMKVRDSAIAPVYDWITVKNIQERFPTASDGSRIWHRSLRDEDDDYLSEHTDLCWKLTSKSVISETITKDYFEQTEAIISYIKNEVFKGLVVPKEYADAIEEFELAKRTVSLCLEEKNKRGADEILEGLKITSLTRETPVEAVYRIVLQEQTNKEKLLSSKTTWTSRRASDGCFVEVGQFDSFGIQVIGGTVTNGIQSVWTGACFSRSK